MILNILFDNKGDFQWASIAAAVSLLAAILTMYGTHKNSKLQKELNDKNISANLKSKARLDWISEVREHTANLMTQYYNLKIADYESEASDDILYNSKAFGKFKNEINILRLYFQNNEVSNDNIDISGEMIPIVVFKDPLDDTVEARNERENLRECAIEKNKSYLAPLYNLTNNKDKHIDIINLLKDIEKNVGSIVRTKDSDDSKYLTSTDWVLNTRVMDKYMEELVSIIGIYLKIEWDIAKRGE